MVRKICIYEKFVVLLLSISEIHSTLLKKDQRDSAEYMTSIIEHISGSGKNPDETPIKPR